MKIQYASDLHLEFPQNTAWLEKKPLQPVGDILLLAGDTHNLGRKFKEHPYLNVLSEQYKLVYIIPGNHEFYAGFDAQICLQENYELDLRPNVFLVNNFVKIIKNVRLIFTTLWSKIERERHAIVTGMSDFHLIKCKGTRLTVENYNQLFEESWAFLNREINTPFDGTTIVVTHHLPSELCNLEKFKGSVLNEAFCVDLTREIEASDIDYWIYGHSHGNKPPFNIGSTMMLTNQLGYVHTGEHRSFEHNATIEL